MRLRLFNADDALTFHRWYHDPRLAHFFRGCTMGVSIEQCTRAPDIMRAHILVTMDDDGKPIGAATFADLDRILRIYRFGLLTDPDCQHKGVGKFTTEKALEWAFKYMNAHRVVCEILAEDERIWKGCEIVGFKHEGTLRESIYLQGKCHDELIYSILRREYFER